jgi:O-antigen/teichoic acid export membrane protein
MVALLSTPFLTRLFAPSAFGVLAVVMALASLMASLASWRYDQAIALPIDDRAAASLAWLAAVLSLTTSITAGAILLIATPWMRAFFLDPLVAPWLWLAPPLALLTSLFAILRYWAMRQGCYRSVATSRACQPLATTATQLAAGVGQVFAAGGLVFGSLIGLAVSVFGIGLSVVLRDWRLLRPGASWRRVLAVAREHSAMPRFAIQTDFLNALSMTALPLTLSASFGATFAGYYLLVERILYKPVQIAVEALWQVNHSALPRLPAAEQRARVLRSNGIAAALLAYPLVGAALHADLFAPVFGERWSEAARLVPWVAAMV